MLIKIESKIRQRYVKHMCEYVSLGKENKSKIKQIWQIKLKTFCFQENTKKKKKRESEREREKEKRLPTEWKKLFLNNITW